MDFENKIKRIKEILDSLNDTELSLKNGMELYKEGVREISEAQKMLEEAKNLYDEIKDETQNGLKDERNKEIKEIKESSTNE